MEPRGDEVTKRESARDLRQRLTPAEWRLWSAVRNRQLDGLKFRRQVPFGPFVADFYCLECRIVVEVDGSVHQYQQEQDAYRDAYMAAHGYRVIRFTNTEVLTNLPAVLERIAELARTQGLPLSSEGGSAST